MKWLQSNFQMAFVGLSHGGAIKKEEAEMGALKETIEMYLQRDADRAAKMLPAK